MQKKGRSKNHQELHLRASVPSPTVECAKDKCLTDKEESRKLSLPGSLKSFQKEKHYGDVTSGAACFKEATTEAKATPRAPMSGVVGDHVKKKEAKAGADTKGDSPQKASCRSNKTRSGPTKQCTDNDCPSQNSDKALRTTHQRRRGRKSNSKREEYPMDKNSFNDTDDTREKVSSTRCQRLRRKRKESKSEEYPMEDDPPGDAEEMCDKPSNTRRRRRRRKRKESKSEEYPIKHNPWSDSDEGKSSSCSESTKTSDMWSVSSLEDIQLVMNTATVEEVQVKSNQQGFISNSEKEEHEVSPDDVPSTNKDNSSASVGSTNLDTSTGKDFTDVDERPILKQAEPSEQVSDMVEYQGGDGYASNSRNHCSELTIYLDAELQVVESELLSLQKVMVKLQSEMREALDTKDCEAELQSLSLDWLTLNKFRSELNKRKKDLIALLEEDKRAQSSGEECVRFNPQVGQHSLNGKLYQKYADLESFVMEATYAVTESLHEGFVFLRRILTFQGVRKFGRLEPAVQASC
ncbi:triadin-like [Pocillopora verrucosa]|uniref:triadin-like n=1 Tax=Pocillopora verrucosa TaxID=203993 RepID=UPI003341DDB8